MEGIAHDDGFALAEDSPDGGTMAAFSVAINDVIVEQREVVNEFHSHCPGNSCFGGRACGFGREHCQS